MDFFFRFCDTVAKVLLNPFIWDLVCWNWLSGFGDIRPCGFLGDMRCKKCFFCDYGKSFRGKSKKFTDSYSTHQYLSFELWISSIDQGSWTWAWAWAWTLAFWLLRCILWVAPKNLRPWAIFYNEIFETNMKIKAQ